MLKWLEKKVHTANLKIWKTSEISDRNLEKQLKANESNIIIENSDGFLHYSIIELVRNLKP